MHERVPPQRRLKSRESSLGTRIPLTTRLTDERIKNEKKESTDSGEIKETITPDTDYLTKIEKP